MGGEENGLAGGPRVGNAHAVEQARREVDQAAFSVDCFRQVECHERRGGLQHRGGHAEVQGERHIEGFVSQLLESGPDGLHLDQHVLLISGGRGIHAAIEYCDLRAAHRLLIRSVGRAAALRRG